MTVRLIVRLFVCGGLLQHDQSAPGPNRHQRRRNWGPSSHYFRSPQTPHFSPILCVQSDLQPRNHRKAFGGGGVYTLFTLFNINDVHGRYGRWRLWSS